MRYAIEIIASFVILVVLGVVGCGSGEVPDENAPVEMFGPPPAFANSHDHSHEHGDTGPHGGHLIELGRNHKYHAELVEDEAAASVTVYVLDTHMEELAIRATSIVLNLTTGGETTAYELAAAGASQNAMHSRFVSANKSLFLALSQSQEISGKLRVTIEGVPYVGRVVHHDRSTHRH